MYIPYRVSLKAVKFMDFLKPPDILIDDYPNAKYVDQGH